MRTARSKRLPRRLIYLRHLLPNVLTGALTVAGLLVEAHRRRADRGERVRETGPRDRVGVGHRNPRLSDDPRLGPGDRVGVVIANTIIDVVLALLNPLSMTADT